MPIDEKYNELSLDGLLYEHSDDLEALYEIYKDEYGSGYGPAPFNDWFIIRFNAHIRRTQMSSPLLLCLSRGKYL